MIATNVPGEFTADAPFEQAGGRFAARVQRAAENVLGESGIGGEIIQLCRDHVQARQTVLHDRTDKMPVIAIVGATGQGKSWLARQMVAPQVAKQIASGNQLDEATETLTWVGPKPPSDLDARHEVYLACSEQQMQSIGTPYLLVDAPGATDDRRSIAGVAQRALSLATILILVIRRDQLRSQRVSGLATASEGTVVIPVVNLTQSDDEELAADVEALTARLRQTAPQSLIHSAVLVADFEVDPRSEAEIGSQAAEHVAASINEAIATSGGLDQRRGVRLAAMDKRFAAAVASVMENQLPDLTATVDRLKRAADKLPGEIAHNLLGGRAALEAVVRSHLRLAFLSGTGGLWFPYRSILGLLNLTHGAWDRMFLTFAGSVPSLVSTLYTSWRNRDQWQGGNQHLANDLRQRTTVAVSDRLGPLARRFRHELNQQRRDNLQLDDSYSIGEAEPVVATLGGIDMLQEQSHTAFEDAIDQGRISRAFVVVCSILGTILFWAMMIGPLVALYRGYLDASYVTISEVVHDPSIAGDLEKFPRPDASMIFTGVVLSLLPTAVFAMIVLSIAQSRRRVGAIIEDLRGRHDRIIDSLRKGGVLCLQWSDPLLADAEFLLSVGRSTRFAKMDSKQ